MRIRGWRACKHTQSAISSCHKAPCRCVEREAGRGKWVGCSRCAAPFFLVRVVHVCVHVRMRECARACVRVLRIRVVHHNTKMLGTLEVRTNCMLESFEMENSPHPTLHCTRMVSMVPWSLRCLYPWSRIP